MSGYSGAKKKPGNKLANSHRPVKIITPKKFKLSKARAAASTRG